MKANRPWLSLGVSIFLVACGGDINVVPYAAETSPTEETDTTSTEETDISPLEDSHSSDAESPQDSAEETSEDTGVTDSTKGDTLASVQVTRTVRVTSWAEGAVLVGAQVCLEDISSECRSTDKEGLVTWTLSVTPGTLLGLTIDALEHYPVRMVVLVANNPPSELTVHAGIPGVEPLEILFTGAQVSANPAAGHAFLRVVGTAGEDFLGPLEGAKIDLLPSSGEGPLYLNAIAQVPLDGLYAANQGSTADGGSALWFNISPGEPQLNVSAPGYRCQGSPESGTIPLAMAVTEGRLTLMQVHCTALSR